MSQFEFLAINPRLHGAERCADDRAAAMTGLVAALVDEVECGLIACNDDGRLLFANRSARDELTSGRVLQAHDGLVRTTAGNSLALDAAVRDAGRRARRRMLTLGSGADRLLASVVPLRCEGQAGTVDASFRAAPTVLIVLGRRGLCSALGVEMLAMVHGLTLAERRVLSELLAGDPPCRIALNQGVAVSTVRTHIKAIRDKVGVRNVEGLFVRAAEVPPVNSALRCGSSVSKGTRAFEQQPRRDFAFARAA